MRSIRWMISLAALGGVLASGVHAQEPDVRDIPPFVMLVVDSSGSMEDLPACTCASETDCSNCAPQCNLLNDAGEPPKDSDGHELKKNRWAVTLEALTGKFVDFQCTDVPRLAENGMTYDEKYAIPYHQPWKCPSGLVCPYPTTPGFQQSDGILDSYIETLRFGLMTFDGEYTYKGGSDLLNEAAFSESLSTSMPGMWSMGGKQSFKYPGCDDTYYVDSGARSEDATEGTLISLDSTKCASAPCDIYELNASIQDALLKTRPYGGTPIAASLVDLYDHLQNGVTDKFKECRKRYAILITDGAPDPDFRDLRCDCESDENPMPCPGAYKGKREEEGFTCPYPLAKDAARKLVAGDGSSANPPQIEKLFVLGMSVEDTEAKEILNTIADAGGTGKALQADDPSTLRSTLDSVFSPLLNPISRSVPGFATGLGGIQYQISTGFQVSSTSLTSTVAPPWAGLIERRSFVCNQSTGKIESPDLTDADRLHKAVNAQSDATKRLWTVLPSKTFTAPDLKKRIGRGGADEMCGTTQCDEVSLRATSVGPFISADSTEALNVVRWMYGDNGSARDGRRFGDVYHSSPTIVGPPPDQAADDAYARFRETPVVKERPLVMYITTNDGVLRAISVEDYPVKDVTVTVHDDDPLAAGQELWGFVPPMLLGQLKGQLSSHQFNFDGTPVVKDVYFQRGVSSTEETAYHTVLITGMRKGGRGYVALDVTDPYKPQFLWQFTDDDMGETYGQPEIVQATFKYTPPGGTTATLQTRAVAILPGGKGLPKGSTSTPGCQVFDATLAFRHSDGSEYESWRVDDITAAKPAKHRSSVQCWQRTGRALYFVDVETGSIIKKVFDSDDDASNGIMLPSPIVGTPTAYLNAVGTTADRGFVMDADGVLWRIDMSSQDVEPKIPTKGWTMRPFHDVFWDKKNTKVDSGETTYERPILTVDENRRLVVLVGTGDTDNFEKEGADNRIVSLTEVINADPPTGPDSYQALINWELRNELGKDPMALQPTELVTGSMALFEGALYAATFISNAGADACEYGRGRLWSLSYNVADKTGDPNPSWDNAGGEDTLTYPPLLVDLNTPTGLDSDDELFNLPADQAVPNMLIQGLGTTQRPSCTKPDPDPLNSYFSPALANIQQIEPPTVWIVAQASGGSRRGGSGLGGVQAGAGRPPTLSRVTSWATSVD